MKLAFSLLTVVAPVLASTHVRAQVREPAPLEIELRPATDGERHRYIVELRTTSTDPLDVAFDRRLLWFEATPAGSRRPIRCRHPAAPTRVDEARVRTIVATSAPLREWVDLRMYCFGRDLTRLDGGAALQPRYGFAGRGSTRRFVARTSPDQRRPWSVINAAPFTLPAVAAAPPPAPSVEGEPPLVLALSPADRRTASSLTFAVSLRGRSGGPVRVYPRDDLITLTVAGPTGPHECGIARTVITPIVDFYQTVTARRSVRTVLDGPRYCPEVFTEEGLYEVTPRIDLIYEGTGRLEAFTGTIVGPPAAVRIRVGDRGYVERPPGGLLKALGETEDDG
jgi:hypothetical protein